MNQAAPFFTKLDNDRSMIGNPYLKPENNHNISLKLSTIENAISIEPYYNFSNNRINRIINFTENDNIQFSYDNVGEYRNKGKSNYSII
ncbi:MAG: outer membrane beta-barrel protein [bacterium]|nr:outer membrane beta-barrel protein [bacterium]